MKTIERLFGYGVAWDEWEITSIAPDDSLRVGTEQVRSRYYREDFDKFYPGFCAAFETLSGIGCDQYFITHVLKVGLVYSGDENIDAFLNSPKLRNSVEAALTLGMSGSEWASSLTFSAEGLSTSELPGGADYSPCDR